MLTWPHLLRRHQSSSLLHLLNIHRLRHLLLIIALGQDILATGHIYVIQRRQMFIGNILNVMVLRVGYFLASVCVVEGTCEVAVHA